ncbi:hypothetical protein PC9H_000508 [Pleurotus ostreatus]|uniref:Uncharacterized protein n=1 Tax=Pleurotus ostreatus TaxID=5322 RepID=A0A8H7DVC0_PLEOS|nr:uncharacterized protein PC9H_000508 [Pleurotus ostreatus]KAF7440164.1 hypothetical protein PC9H_000508 [Pleurotus ostreatus]
MYAPTLASDVVQLPEVQVLNEPESSVGTLQVPPPFAQHQWDTILRRQRSRPKDGKGVKSTSMPSIFVNLSNLFEFAGWGTFDNLTFAPEDLAHGKASIQAVRRDRILGQFTASAIAGNAVLGSVFYALPAVVAISSVYAPISLFVACLSMFLWRPIMEELGSALPINGAPYTYFNNVANKKAALICASILVLDFLSTAVVSAATATSYLSGEVALPFPAWVGAAFILVVFTFLSLTGVRESARLALAMLSFHILTMIVLMIAAAVHWAHTGNEMLRDNWNAGKASSSSGMAHQIFNGVCLGVLGLTGFETTPSYLAKMKTNVFPLVLRNLHYPAILFNVILMTSILAIIRLPDITSGANILSLLADKVGGPWLRIWIVVDAMVVLCGGVLAGFVSSCQLFEQLALDRILPQFYLRTMRITSSPYISIFTCASLCALLYASAAADLSLLSKMFSFTFLCTMATFPFCLLLLKFHRGRLPRTPHTPLLLVFVTMSVSAVLIAGNIAIDPTTAGYFAPYFIGVFLIFLITQNKAGILRFVLWFYDHHSRFHSWKLTKGWGARIINIIATMKRQPVCILVKGDEIHILSRMLIYAYRNEVTSCVKIIHFTDNEKGMPSELEANARILDEAFPQITIDLVIVYAPFSPVSVATLAHRLNIPPSLMFMGCPGKDSPYELFEFGTRIITS